MDRPAGTLAVKLRMTLGADVKGIGPDAVALVELWSGEPPEDLRSAIDALERNGFIRIDRGFATSDSPAPREFGLRGIVGISVTERLQEYLDRIGL